MDERVGRPGHALRVRGVVRDDKSPFGRSLLRARVRNPDADIGNAVAIHVGRHGAVFHAGRPEVDELLHAIAEAVVAEVEEELEEGEADDERGLAQRVELSGKDAD